jgi:Zn-dependent peptidase ImmA (M78 family)
MEPEEYEVEGDNGDTRITMERHRSLCARFVVQALSLLNTTVAKNWSRFDQFHELLHFFALADISDIEKLTTRKTEGEN